MSFTVDKVTSLFPVYLNLEQTNLLIVGEGEIALEKLTNVLLNSPDARVLLVARVVSDEIKELAKQHEKIEIVERAFEEEDIISADVVIIAAINEKVSENIWKLAKQHGKLIYAPNKPGQSNFFPRANIEESNVRNSVLANGVSVAAGINGDARKPSLATGKGGNKEVIEKNIRWRRVATYSVSVFALMLIGHFIFSYVPLRGIAHGTVELYQTLDKNFHWMVLAGFLAQLVDGALGMGYGVTSATILLSSGVNLASISSSIHTAEMFASGASGYSHYKFGNVNKKMFKLLVIPGVIGAIAGAILLSRYGDTQARYLKPVMAVYTLFLGLRILTNAFREQKNTKKFKNYRWLAGIGGFLDSFGGGGWGPIVTTTLITRGRSPKYVIGSVSLTEFFVTLASAFTFFTMLGVTHWQVIVALILGGLVAAPLAAKLAGRLPRKASFILLGLLVIIWSMKILVQVF